MTTSPGLDRAYGTLFASLLMVAMVLLVAGAVLALAPDQAAPPPECVNDQDGEMFGTVHVPECPAPGECVQVSLSNRGLPPCEGDRPGSARL